MASFNPPPFRTHPLIRGGHLQTVVSIRAPKIVLANTRTEIVTLDDGDSVALHWDFPVKGNGSEQNDFLEEEDIRDEQQPVSAAATSATPVLLLIHGLSGCHGSPYMIRLAHEFTNLGFVVVRMDMRGCGAASELSYHISHAGRSDDIAKALAEIARAMPKSPLYAIGVSLGGNQLLRLVGRIGAGIQSRPDWFDALERIATVAPPIDLLRCSDNMQRISRRPYNWYFIRQLLRRIPAKVRQRADCQQILTGPRPRTLLELDQLLTAPLSGFDGARQYYASSGACHVVNQNPIETLILVAQNDPIIPVDCYTQPSIQWPKSSHLLISPSGGHAGYVGRGREFWMDTVLKSWITKNVFEKGA